MNLHRSSKASDWTDIKLADQNRWQRLASQTNGYVTPANFVTLLGFGLVLIGIYNFSQGRHGVGVWQILIGRLMDFFDGWVANKTLTKSRFGESLDATVDKLEALITIPALAITHVIPLLPLIFIFTQGTINVVLTTYAKSKKRQLHPSKEGKLNAGAQWLGIGLFMLIVVIEPDTDLLKYAAYLISLGSTLSWGLISSYQLAKTAFNTQQTSARQ